MVLNLSLLKPVDSAQSICIDCLYLTVVLQIPSCSYSCLLWGVFWVCRVLCVVSFQDYVGIDLSFNLSIQGNKLLFKGKKMYFFVVVR